MYRFRATKIRLYPTPEQAAAFGRIAGCCRLVYNLALEQRRDHWRAHKATTGTSFTWFSQKRELPALKEVAPFLREAPAHALQSALRDVDTAFRRFFDGTAGYPRPRRRYVNDSFQFPEPSQIRMDFANSALVLPKFKGSGRSDDNGPVLAVFHRRLAGQLRSVTVSRSGAHWYASILMRVEVGEPRARAPRRDNVVGVDRGVTVPFAASDGALLGTAIESRRQRERQRRLARDVSRAKRASNNRAKALQRLAQHKAKMVRRRADMIHQASARIVKNHDVVGLEDIRVKSMTASAKGTLEAPGRNIAPKAGLNRAVLDRGWGEFRRQCEYKLAWKGGQVVKVRAAYSSQTCSACGAVDAASRNGVQFTCTACAHTQHADTNAAIIIEQRALAQLGLGPPGPSHHWRPTAGVVAAAPGELCTGISSKGEENRGGCIPGKDPNKASGETAGALPR